MLHGMNPNFDEEYFVQGFVIGLKDDVKIMVKHLMCPSLPWVMQGHIFSHDVRRLPLGGCDMVLGVDWMRSYSPMVFDFQKMEVTFEKNGEPVLLRSQDHQFN